MTEEEGPFPSDQPFAPGQSYAGGPDLPAGLPQHHSPPHAPASPAGHEQYGAGMEPLRKPTSGMAMTSFVLSLVQVVPCLFWLVPIPAVLAVVFGFIARAQLAKNPARKGAGMALAGIIIGFLFILLAIGLWIWIATSGNCEIDYDLISCETDR